jgi:hypothetical protein
MWRRLVLAGVLAGLGGTGAEGQEWRIGAQFGRLQNEAGAGGSAADATVVLGLWRTGLSDAFSLSGTVPLQGQPLWGTASLWKRFTMDTRVGLGLDVAGHGFMQRETFTVEQTPPPGLPVPGMPPRTPELVETTFSAAGGGGQVAVLGFARVSDVRVEARAGVAGTALQMDGVDGWIQEGMSVFDARALLNVGLLRVEPEVQHWRGSATYAGSLVRAGVGRIDAWASAGQWLNRAEDDPVLGGGLSFDGGYGVRLEAAYRTGRYEPLYDSAIPASASLGASIRLGSRSAFAAPVPASYANGRAVIRLSARDVRGAGTPHLAGDFSDWKPVAMTRAGNAWLASVALEPGVYNYAFVSADGEWFVPASTPGRRDDGMGGHVAVLVVTQ